MPKSKILIIDDDDSVRISLKDYLEDSDFEVRQAENGVVGLTLLEKEEIDIVFLDLRMPKMDGLEVLKRIHKRNPDQAVVIISGQGTVDDVIECLREGAWDYMIKPISDFSLLDAMIKKVLARISLIKLKDVYQSSLEDSVLERTRELRTEKKHINDALVGLINVISAMLEKKDPYTVGHEHRVALLAKAIAEEMSLPKLSIEGLFLAGQIHDLGKIAIPTQILSKPGRLTDIEFSLIKTHAEVGYEILKDIQFPWPIADIVYQHHERLDGKGYPNGLIERDLLIESKILAVSDVVEAMASHRPYRVALGIDKALIEIKSGRGLRYDDQVVDVCLDIFKKKKFEFEVR